RHHWGFFSWELLYTQANGGAAQAPKTPRLSIVRDRPGAARLDIRPRYDPEEPDGPCRAPDAPAYEGCAVLSPAQYGRRGQSRRPGNAPNKRRSACVRPEQAA